MTRDWERIRRDAIVIRAAESRPTRQSDGRPHVRRGLSEREREVARMILAWEMEARHA